MADLDSLPADQRAALQLLLKQGQSYDQLAVLLGIGPDAVRDRAHAALAALGAARRLGGSSETTSETRHAYRLDSASRSAAARASSMSVWVVNRTRRPSADQQMAHPSR